MARTRNSKSSFISLNPSFFTHLLSIPPFNSLHYSPRKNSRITQAHLFSSPFLFFCFISLLVTLTFFVILMITFTTIFQNSVSCPETSSPLFLASVFAAASSRSGTVEDEPFTLSTGAMVPLPAHGVVGNFSEEEKEFWKQPDHQGYVPCLDFSLKYRKASAKISKERRKFLVVVASGGLNQQRNQIVDAVVIARILEAALVVPVLQVNHIWGDDSEFSDIFDVEHFKKTLKADVRIVASLPSTHFVSKQTINRELPFHVSPLWLRARFLKQLNQEGLLILKGLDSKLSKNLPPDLQKLKCKVAFHALRFATPIRELGYQIARRMWIEGPYVAIHLRLEKDVWIRTRCLTGLGRKYDSIISRERDSHPEYLTGKLNMTHAQRRLAGMCPLNASEMAR
ncbi:O-fucosyltransferase 37 [Datura stramonium]|uniref:O-fucosyltransferase family protein n=1 Tax=Datura stramonium TaxID=4076 RepID=A0ABS8RWE8_DATST|nr:O-fucosyltransferase 37 [Datura stramonium]